MQPTPIRTGGATLNQTPLDWAGNARRIRGAVADAKAAGIDLLCLPELCLPGYGCEDAFFADHLHTRCLQELQALLPISQDICFSVGLPFLYNQTRYNGQALLADGALLGIALKHHLANDGVYYEQRWFSSWPKGQALQVDIWGRPIWIGHPVFEWRGQRIAFEICEDAWRGPDRLAHLYASQGVDILLNPSASHFTFGKERNRHHLAQAGSALIKGTYIYANLLGNEAGRLIFDGDVVIYKNGLLVTEASSFAWKEHNVLPEERVARQPEFLPKEAEFEQATTLGLYDYMRKSRSKGFCLSLSGGADSACCAVLVHRLGLYLLEAYQTNKAAISSQLSYWPALLAALETKEEGVYMPLLLACLYQQSANSTATTQEAARGLAKELSALYKEVDIDPFVQGYTKQAEMLIGRPLTWEADDLALQNIQARVRAPMIWYWTNLRGSLLLTTSNRSEGSVGYSTMDGDMAGGLAPIAGVSKDFVRAWLNYAETAWGYTSLQAVNNLAPTAELRPATEMQTDEADLMPYALLDQIEHLLIYKKTDPDAALAYLQAHTAFDAAYLKSCIARFGSLWARNQWKRERLAPSFFLDAYSIDPKTWCRYPILSGE